MALTLCGIHCRYDPNTPNNTRQVEEPTLGHCDFNSSAPCGAQSPSCMASLQPRSPHSPRTVLLTPFSANDMRCCGSGGCAGHGMCNAQACPLHTAACSLFVCHACAAVMHYTQTVQTDCTPDVLDAGTRGPTAVPYTHDPSESCPATYTTDYRGGTFGQPLGDLQVSGLSSNYIVRCVCAALTMCSVSDAALR
jgi:hypothetical protein